MSNGSTTRKNLIVEVNSKIMGSDYIESWLNGWCDTVQSNGMNENRRNELLNFIHEHMIRYDWVTMTEDEHKMVTKEFVRTGGVLDDKRIAEIRDTVILKNKN